MTKLTEQHYHEQAADCDGLCKITDDKLRAEPGLMQCVSCPFCKDIVNAEVTKTHIKCPSCKASVRR